MIDKNGVEIKEGATLLYMERAGETQIHKVVLLEGGLFGVVIVGWDGVSVDNDTPTSLRHYTSDLVEVIEA